MSSSWSALHAQLLHSVQRSSRKFTCLASRHPSLSRFPDPTALLDEFHGPGGDPDGRNDMLRALVAEAKAGDDCLTVELVLLALWPGLDAVRGRLRRFARDDLQTLDVDLLGRFSLAIRTCNLDRVFRIAATLLRNLERDLRRDLMREASRGRISVPIEDLRLADERPESAERIAKVAAQQLGRDGPLIAAVVFLGFTQSEAGAALGLRPAQARKRFRRAIDRLRRDVSHSPRWNGFSPSTAPVRRKARRTTA
ncbi:hypothetical protein ATO6_23490 [Oceanicola sp. 22II-s10i]|uniref:sigma-70 family RNA polymerase sigma factor n=1 Tax=Oceanicola sp. 22II-s10i TaxID=1317116 RepID=UPI000B51F5E0|nr:sigma-70 family RNA polymerase sigma factor [Oceanicola sp. 22II-s10i]OWU81708.1 hypothetical protein ATO6_23490 [Oceanicola sp. 22II-s10i]